MRKKPSIFETLYAWTDERLGISPLFEFARAKRVPEHKHSAWYYVGGLCVFLFCIQVITGILLMVYYRPGPGAYESVWRITNEIPFGGVVRSIHKWSAHFLIAAALMHMFSVFFMKAYRKPREFGWWTGLGLLGVCLMFGFSGYLLPMDELALSATRVGLALLDAIPWVNHLLTSVLRGGPDVSDVTVARFYVLHVAVLPLLFTALLAPHLWLVHRHGNALPPGMAALPRSRHASVPFFPTVVIRDMVLWLVVLNVLALLAVVFPAPLESKASPLSPASEGIHPEWYFMAPFEALKVMGRVLPGVSGEIAGMMIFAVAIGLWFLIPLLDTGKNRWDKPVGWFGIAVIFILLVLTIAGYVEVL